MKHALLIIDVQQALCSGAEAAFDIDRVVDRINFVSTKARVAGAPVFLIQHEETEGSLQYGTEGWQLYERLAVQPEDIRVRKTTHDSFHKTELQSLLQAGTSRRLSSAAYRVISAWPAPSAECWRWATQSCSYRTHIRLWTTAFSPRRRSRRIITPRWRTLEALVRELH
jgi:hypothetical protein